ncbi:hypothetical protein [Carboxylicivirga taeanensis]|uniref:hypothetical protein n=1 Tax=Carboxylicivirga taeanensis TaxID=1416875 RepID=UPI003F6E09BA
MENPGEHLVGQYLREIKKCDFVEYNLQTKFTQGEIDVVGIDSVKKEVFICEVATHLETGLQYTKNNRPDNVNRFVDKFTKNVKYARKNFSGYKCHFMLWTPIIKIPKKENAKNNQLNDIITIKNTLLERQSIDLELIYNESYLDCINKLRARAKETSQALTSPILRFLQIEEKLKQHLLNKNGSL